MIVTLLSGKFTETDVKQLVESYDNDFPVIISTWKDQISDRDRCLLETKKIKIVLSEPITSDISINLQLGTIREGLKYIKQNYEPDIIIKSRTDIYPIGYRRMIDYIVSSTFDDKLMILYKFNYRLLYYCDLIVIGKTESINKFYNIPDTPKNIYPELYLLDSYSGYVPEKYTHEYLNKYFVCIGKDLRDHFVEFIWKRNKDIFDKIPVDYLSDYKSRLLAGDYTLYLLKDFLDSHYLFEN